MKRTIKLTEGDLKQMIAETVRRTIKETYEEDNFDNYNEASHKVANMIGDFVYKEKISVEDALKGCELAMEQLGGVAY